MPATARSMHAAYAEAFRRYLARDDESTLRAAYELGRDAVEHELNVLDLAVVHHDALLAALRDAGRPEEIDRIARAAADFFLESLSAFEMVRRGFREAHEAAATERRQAATIRRLSSFLADASLTRTGSGSHRELLQLVAEHATELTDAEYCVAAASLDGGERAVAFSAGGTGPRQVPGWLAEAVESRRALRAPLRSTADDIRRDPAFAAPRRSAEAPVLRNALAAPLTALDGRELGFVHAFNRRVGDFTEVDEAVLLHLAQMASAALERAQLYGRQD